ncbi:MAG: amino acid adenylation domain-containing protein, partial [bacterium]|nr:amino acid adenylation domain-containing protein [bacterium]
MNKTIYKELLFGSDNYSSQLNYWANLLDGEPKPVELPIDFRRSMEGQRKEDSFPFEVPAELARKLLNFSKNSDLVLYIFLLAALRIFLSRYAGNHERNVLSPLLADKDETGNREKYNSRVFFRDFADNTMTYRELVKETGKEARQAYENQDYPMEMVFEKKGMKIQKLRSLERFVFQLENIHEKGETNHWEWECFFSLERENERIRGKLFYDKALFRKESISRIAAGYVEILKTCTEHADVEINRLQVLTEAQIRQLLLEFNGSQEEYTHDKTIHRLFEEQAAKTPGNISVEGPLVFGEDCYSRLSYRQLNGEANRLARKLKAKGVSKSTTVGLMASRSLEMIAGMLAIIKAGGACLPIDPEYPRERIAYMIADSGLKLLLTNCEPGKIPAAGEKIETVELACDNSLAGEGDNTGEIEHDQPAGAGHHLLYVIYTSGSTGKPKGVLIEHRNLVNLINYQYRHTCIDFSRVLQFSTISFDVSFQEIFSTLLSGGRLYMIDKELRHNIPGMFQTIEKNEIKTLFFPASFLKFVMNEESFESHFPKTVKHIVSAGEQLVVGDGLREYLKKNNVNLHNHYGPSETHVVTTLTVEPGEDIPGLPAIGRPVSNIRIYILDREKHPAPLGVAGELYIGGEQVGRGYLNRPEFTHEAFINMPNPWTKTGSTSVSDALSKDAQLRLFKTGDLARWQPDGTIEFLGRRDYQVKIRGFRVELGEIESLLLAHEAIKETAVVAIEGKENEEKTLCAYAVPKKDVTGADLHQYLAKKLPDYMLPANYRFLDKIPLTANQKIDTDALPLPGPEERNVYVAPGNPVEDKLAKIWAEILGKEKCTISINDNFFRMGGQSLKATVLTARIHKEFDVVVPMTELFKTPTISELTQYIRGAGEDRFIPVEKTEKKEYYPLSSAQKRLYIIQQMDLQSTGYHIPSFMQLEGELEKEKLEKVFEKLVNRHESLRTSFERIYDEPVQRIRSGVEFKLTYYEPGIKPGEHGTGKENKEQSGESAGWGSPGRGPEREIIKRFMRPFDLAAAPLLRVGLVKIAKKRWIIMVDMHHIISDGTSMQVFVDEFLELYADRKLPEVNIQYRDFTQWQNRLLQSGEFRKQENYWLERFKDRMPQLELTPDYPNPAVGTMEAGQSIYRLDKEKTARLQRMAAQYGTTMHILLLAFYNIMLAKYTDQDDIVVGVPVSGRRHADLHGIIGMFVNMLAMRNAPGNNNIFEHFLKEVAGNSTDAYENKDYQLDTLVEKHKPQTKAKQPLWIQTFFEYLNSGFVPQVNIPGLEL